MLLLAVEHCHKNWVLHRDIKPSNCLLGENGTLKLADFGLGKLYGSPSTEMSPQAVTLWYRAPELLFGAKSYGPAADMWSVGCIFGELMLRAPLFAGKTEMDQLGMIFGALGVPNQKDWPDVATLPAYVSFEREELPMNFLSLFMAASQDAKDLLMKLLTVSPLQRLTATQALRHSYFSSQPPPTPVGKLPKLPSKSRATGSTM